MIYCIGRHVENFELLFEGVPVPAKFEFEERFATMRITIENKEKQK